MLRKIEIPIPRIRTGYYGSIKLYENADYTLLSVSRTTPKLEGSNIKALPILAPSEKLLSDYKEGRITWVQYERQYRDYLSTLDLEDCVEAFACLTSLEHTRGIVLLCYEKDFMHCHRSILAEVLNESGLIDEAVEEFKKNE